MNNNKIIEMSDIEKKKQDLTFNNLNKFILKYKKYIKCSKQDLMKDIPIEILEIILKRQYFIDNSIIDKLKKYKDFEYLVNKKKDDRSVLSLIYYVVTTQIFENVLIELLKNFNCKIEKVGSNFNYNLNKARADEDIKIITNNNTYKIELQRSNFMLYNNAFELKYSKINKNILNYTIDKQGNLKLICINLNPKDKNNNNYVFVYSNYLNTSHKKGFYINNIKIDDFKDFEELIEKFNNFDDVFNYIFK